MYNFLFFIVYNNKYIYIYACKRRLSISYLLLMFHYDYSKKRKACVSNIVIHVSERVNFVLTDGLGVVYQLIPITVCPTVN